MALYLTPSKLSQSFLKKGMRFNSSRMLLPTKPQSLTTLSSLISSTSSSTIRLSHQKRNLSSKSRIPEQPNPKQNPELPTASFSEIFKNASKMTRMVLLGGLVLLATAESVTWGVWGWRRWNVWRAGGEGDG
ncbi:hypothetical protein HYFRA_00003281 [Hymenoscyphus fraxineus]|uniref:Uncharacterized protein n=1 Tax=Hymenoscyphus fraxineus TaxID=746836 RepID=A0A9N9KU20_9HELO|nr:hypothetical protein HYFRA_00003281 [Hymenoscyphus fraxineus]